MMNCHLSVIHRHLDVLLCQENHEEIFIFSLGTRDGLCLFRPIELWIQLQPNQLEAKGFQST